MTYIITSLRLSKKDFKLRVLKEEKFLSLRDNKKAIFWLDGFIKKYQSALRELARK